jgi:hypothetical protein
MRKQVRAKEALEELERLMQTGELKERYRAAIGVGDTSDFALVATTLTVMAGAGDALDPDFLAELIAEEYRRKIDREMLGKVLVFAERLSLARRRPDESWQLEPDVATAFAG